MADSYVSRWNAVYLHCLDLGVKINDSYYRSPTVACRYLTLKSNFVSPWAYNYPENGSQRDLNIVEYERRKTTTTITYVTNDIVVITYPRTL